MHWRNIRLGLPAAVLFLMGGMGNPVGAQVVVSNVILNFPAGGRPFQDVSVRNTADAAMFVVSNVNEVTNPGEAEEKQIPTEEIIVSPKRFSIPPQGQRVARLLVKHPARETGHVYRVVFQPHQGGFDENETKVPEKTGEKRTTIKVMTTVGILIFVEPKEATATLSWRREPGKIVFTNTGNVHSRVVELKACPPKEGSECNTIGTRRAYPGRELSFNVPDEQRLEFKKAVGEEGKLEEVKVPPLR